MDILKIFFPDRCPLCERVRPFSQTGFCPECILKLERAKDIPGFINYMFVRGIIFGCIISAFSAITIIKDYFAIDSTVYL